MADMKAQILDAAMRLAKRKGFAAVTRDAVAPEAGVATGTVSYHWGETKKLRTAVVARAIAEGNVPIIAGALAEGHHLAKSAPPDLKKRAATLICS